MARKLCLGSLRETACNFNFLALTKSPLVSADRSYGDLSSWHWNPGVGPWGGAGSLTPEISLQNFYPVHMGGGSAHFSSVPLLPVWMNVASLIPLFPDFHSTQYLMVLSDGCPIFL